METPLDEWELAIAMRAAQTGDRAAYARVLTALLPLLTRYVRGRLRDASRADDVVQEILLSLHRVRHTYDSTQPLLPWVYAIANYRVLDAQRREGRQRHRESDTFDEPIFLPAHAEHASTDPRHDALDTAIAALSPRAATVVRLLKIDGLSVSEVATRTGQHPSAVKVMAHRAYRTMRAWMEKEGYGSR